MTRLRLLHSLTTTARREQRAPDLIEAAIAAAEPAREILARLERERAEQRAVAAEHAVKRGGRP